MYVDVVVMWSLSTIMRGIVVSGAQKVCIWSLTFGMSVKESVT
jgi:hypothetical protein